MCGHNGAVTGDDTQFDGPFGIRLVRVGTPRELRPRPEQPADPPDRPADPTPWSTGDDAWHATTLDQVVGLLGRDPRSSFAVVVRELESGMPVVIRNPPLLDDGTPMPTRYWLLKYHAPIGTVEADGGVRRAEREVDPAALAAAHSRYAAERDAAVPVAWQGPRPTGGVGGTRRGVKCLHTHYAHYLATGDDPVGAWVHERLAIAHRLSPGR